MDGEPRHLHVTARTPERAKLAEAIRELLLEHNAPRIDDAVLQARQPQIVKITHEYLKNQSQGTARLAVLEAIQARSIASAPMITNDRVSGVLTAVSATRIYDALDLQVLVQIAERAALAIENASLHAALHQGNTEMRARVDELQAAQARIRTLTGLLPVCAWCGLIRDDSQGGQWRRFDQYVTEHTAADITHSICPDCASRQRSRG
jgi:transcriptional regulator with GAF, ATPase, and Fis domain